MSDDTFADSAGGDNTGRTSGRGSWEVDASSWLDAVFDLLADERRRRVFYCLVQDPDGVVERGDLIAAIRNAENAEEGDGAPTETSIERDLHHVQLPRLADAGFIDYDPRQGTVRYTGSRGLGEWVEKAYEQEGAEGCSTDS